MIRTPSCHAVQREQDASEYRGARLIEGPGGAGRPTGVVDHIAFEVHDLDAVLATLRACGVRLLHDEPPRVPAVGARIAFCLGLDAERIKLFEPAVHSRP